MEHDKMNQLKEQMRHLQGSHDHYRRECEDL